MSLTPSQLATAIAAEHIRHAPRTLARKLSSAERQDTADLGFTPEADEVADLLTACLQEGVIADEDRHKIDKTLQMLRAGTVLATDAYAILVDAVKCGPASERALDALTKLYEPDDVIELRALDPKGGGAVSLNGQLSCHRERMTAFIRQHIGQRNLYYGINPRRPDLAGTTQATKAKDAQCRRHIVLDLDKHSAPLSDPGWSRMLPALSALDPVTIVASGNGHHVWFAIETVSGLSVRDTAPLLDSAMAALGADNMADPPRIIRCPFTINIPTKSKRERSDAPARLALARLVQPPKPEPTRHELTALVESLKEVAQRISLPGRKLQAAASAGSTPSASRSSDQQAAPDEKLLRDAMSLLPNTEDMGRDFQVMVAHAARGAAQTGDFNVAGREAFLDWSSRWPLGGDPAHDEKLYDDIRDPHSGWPHIKTLLREHNPAGFAQIEAREAPFRFAQARAAFAAAPIPDDELREIESASAAIGSQPSYEENDEVRHEPADRANIPRSDKRGAATVAIELLRREGHAEFFCSRDGKSWLRLLGRIRRIDESKGCRAALAWLAGEGVILTGNAKNDLKDQMLARAMRASTHEVFFRQATGPDRARPEAFLNLMNADGDGIHIDTAGWRIKPLSALPVCMTDREKALPLPAPFRAKDGVKLLERLRRHIPLAAVNRSDDPADTGVQQEAVVLMFLGAQIYRPGAVPHLTISAAQGSGKTTAARRLKSLTDPDSVEVVTSLPSDEAALYAIAEQQTVLVIDNASSIKNPDTLAALATGAGHQKRELYTDGGRTVFSAKTSVALTTVREELTQRPDLRDRMLQLDLPPIDRRKRRTEAELDECWEKDAAHLLADLLDLVSAALPKLKGFQQDIDAGRLPPPPRLADAALLAEGMAQAAGWKPGLCLAALNAMRENDAARQLEEHPVAARIRELLNTHNGSWTGTARELMNALRFMHGPDWGRAAASDQAFTSALNRVEGLLRGVWGIEIERSRSAGTRSLALRSSRS